MDISELERSAAEAKANGQTIKALAVINPGNPTGQCLPYANMVEVVKFCEREDIVLMADEVRSCTRLQTCAKHAPLSRPSFVS